MRKNTTSKNSQDISISARRRTSRRRRLHGRVLSPETLEARRVLAAGDISIFAEAGANENITTADFSHDFDTLVRNDNALTHSLTGSNIGVSEGHHLVLYNSRFDSTNGGNRSEIQSQLNLDGNDLAIGWSQGYIRRSNGQNETITAGGGIIDVPAGGGTLQLQSFRTDNNGGAQIHREPNASGIQLIKLNDGADYARLSLSSNQTGPNNATFLSVPFDSQEELDTASFGHSTTVNPADITLKTPGHYMVFANTFLNETQDRTSLIQRLTLDGTLVDGSMTSVYIRGNQQSTSDGAASIGMVIETTSANQILNVQGSLDVNRSSTFIGGRTGITIVKLPDSGEFLRMYEPGGQNLNNGATLPLNFDAAGTQLEVDASFSHSTSTNPSRIGVTADDDYLFLTSAFDNNDGVQRGFYWQRWRVNGGTPETYGHTGRYSRSSGGADQFGNWSGFVTGLSNGDYVEAVTQALGRGGTNTVDRQAIQGIALSSIFGEPPVIANMDGDSVTYTNSGPVELDAAADAAVTDLDTTNFNGGSVSASITVANDPSEDVLGISAVGGITVTGQTVGSTVSHGGMVIGTITSDGTGGTDLEIALTTNDATLAAVQALVRALHYDNTTALNPQPRTVEVVVADPGGFSGSAAVTVMMDIFGTADNVYWVGTTGGGDGSSAADAGNWDVDGVQGAPYVAGVPDGNDIAVFYGEDPATVDFGGGSFFLGGVQFTAGDYDLSNGTLILDSVDQDLGDNTVSAVISSLALAGTVDGGTLTLGNFGNVAGISDGSWTIGGGTLVTSATATDSTLGSASVDVNLTGGTLDVIPVAAGGPISNDPDLLLWLDASDLDGDGTPNAVAPGTSVTNWVSRATANPNNAATPANNPTVSGTTLNGQQLVNFSNTGAHLDFTSQIVAQESTIAIVYRNNGGSGWINPLDDDDTAACGGASHLHMIRNGSNERAIQKGCGNQNLWSGVPSTQWAIQTMQLHQGDYRLWVDGVLTGPSASTQVFGNIAKVGNINGDIAEVLIYDTVSTSKLRDAENYLNAKYGLPLLPAIPTEVNLGNSVTASGTSTVTTNGDVSFASLTSLGATLSVEGVFEFNDTTLTGDLTVTSAAGGDATLRTVSGSADLTASGPAIDVILPTVNTYTGATTVTLGATLTAESGGLGDVATGTTVDADSSLVFPSGNATVEPLAITGTGSASVMAALSGDGTVAGPITLDGDATVHSSGSLSLAGVISDGTPAAGTLTIAGNGVNLSAANTFTGNVLVPAGAELTVVGPLGTLGDVGGTTTVDDGGSLTFDSTGGSVNSAETITLNGTGVGGQGALGGLGGDTFLSGVVTLATDTSADIAAGTIELSGTLAGPGALTIAGGTLAANGATITVPAVNVDSGGTFGLAGNTTLNSVDFVIDGTGATGDGAIVSLGGDNTLVIGPGAGSIVESSRLLSFGAVAGSSLTITTPGGGPSDLLFALGYGTQIIANGDGDVHLNGQIQAGTVTTYAQVMQSLNPNAYWTFDSKVGVTVADQSGNHDGTLVGGADITTGAQGIVGEALELTGNGQYLDAANPTAFDFNSSFTWSALINTTDGSGAIASRNPDGTAWNQGSKAFFVRGSQLQADAGWVGNPGSGTVVNDGGWHHVVASFDAATDLFEMYVDGTAMYSNGFDMNRYDEHNHFHNSGYADTSFTIGAADFSGGLASLDTLIGRIDEVSIFNQAFSGTEIDALDPRTPVPPLPNGVIKNGDGTLTLNGDNTFDGPTTINGGTLIATHDGSLGLATDGTTVADGATLAFLGGFDETDEAINLASSALRNISGDNRITGAASLTIDPTLFGTIDLISDAGLLTVDPDISTEQLGLHLGGAGDILVNGDVSGNPGGGPVTLSGLTAERYEFGNNLNFHGQDGGNYTIASDGTFDQNAGMLNSTPTHTGGLFDFGDMRFSRNRQGQTTAPYPWSDLFGTTVGIPNDASNFQIVWTGHFTPDVTGDYLFRSGGENGGNPDDNASFFLDQDFSGSFVIGEGFNSGGSANRTLTGLVAGTAYPVIFGFREGGGGDHVRFRVDGPATSAIPNEVNINPVTQSTFFTTTIGIIDNSVTKTGSGTATLSGNNSYNGETHVQAGTLVAASSTALGTAATGTTVADDARLALDNSLVDFADDGDDTNNTANLTINEPITLGADLTTPGILQNLDGNNSVVADVTAEAMGVGEVAIASDGVGSTLTVSGNVNLNVASLQASGAGDTTISGVIVPGTDVNDPTLGDAISALSPTAYWDFNSKTGTTVPDVAAGNHDGTLTAGADITTGDQGYGTTGGEALLPNGDANGGTRGHLSASDPQSFDFNSDFTWHAMIKVASGGNAGIVSRSPGNTNWNQGSKAMFLESNGRLEWDTGWVSNPSTSTDLRNNQWRQVVAVYTAATDNLRLYVDGVAEYNNTHNVNRYDEHTHFHNGGMADSNFMIGFTSPNFENAEFPGLIDDVAVYDRTLTPAEVVNLYNTNGVGLIDADNGLRKTGSGTLNLSGANTYDDGTTIQGGSLLVTNTSGSGTGPGTVTVESGGTVGGTGSIAGDVTVNAGGSVSPGAAARSTGTLTLDGNVLLEDGSTLEIDVTHPDADQVVITTGTFVLENSNVQLDVYTNGVEPTTQYLIVDDQTTNTAASHGTFTVLNNPSFPTGTQSIDDASHFTTIDYVANTGNDIELDGDDEAPMVDTLSPANGQLMVPTSPTTFTVTFDEPVQVDTDTPSWEVELYHDSCGGAGAPIATLTLTPAMVSGDTLTLDFSDPAVQPSPLANLAPGEYWVSIPPGAIEDPSFNENPFAGITSSVQWSFSTESTTGPLGAGWLNEILFNPEDGDYGREYIELRGTPGSAICPDVHLLAVSGEGANAGQVEHIFNLGGLSFGSNGFIVLTQSGHPYPANYFAPGTAVVTAGDGDGWLDTDHSDFFSHEGPHLLKNTSTSFLMVRSTPASAPTLGQQVGLANGSLDVPAIWNVGGDSVAFVDGDSDIAYGNIVFHNGSLDSDTQIPTGNRVETAFTPDYLARSGDTTGSAPADWLAGLVEDVAPDYSLHPTDATLQTGAPLDHLGASNFAERITVTSSGGSNDVTEGNAGTNDTFTVNLNQLPNAPVSLDLDGNGQVQLSLNGSVFSNALVGVMLNDTNPVTIHIRATDDSDAENDHTGSVSFAVTSGDPRFDGLQVPDASVNITDNEPATGDLQIVDTIVHFVDATSTIFSITVENTGSAAVDLNGPTAATSDNVFFQAYLSADELHNNPGGGDILLTNAVLGASPLPILAPGESFTATYTGNAPIDVDQRPYLTLAIDSNDVISEGTNPGESNNESATLLAADPVFLFETPTEVFSGAPGSTLPVSITAQAFVGDMVGFQLNFENSDSGLQIHNWQNNSPLFPFALDDSLDTDADNNVVAASAFNTSHGAGSHLGNFDLTLPAVPGTYTLSVNSNAGVAETSLTDPNNDPIPIYFHGDITVVVSNDITAPTANVIVPLVGSTVTSDPGFISVQLTDGGVNPTGIATGTVDPSDLTITGVDIDRVEDQGNGVWNYYYGDEGETLPNGLIVVNIAAGAITDGANNPVAATTETFTFDNTAPEITGVAYNVNEVDPADIPEIGPQPTSWELQRSSLRDIQLTFTEDVSGMTVNDLVLTNLGLDPDNDDDVVVALDASNFQVAGNVVTLSFDREELADGVYQLEVTSVDAFGNRAVQPPIVGNTGERLYQFLGDWNGDGRVTIFDFNVMAYWFGRPTAPEYTDLNNDGGTSIFDFSLFRNQFTRGVVLEDPPRAVDDGSEASPFLQIVNNGFDFAIDVLANDVGSGLFLLEVNPWVAGETADNANADVFINADGTIGYEAADVDSGYQGVDLIEYTVSDGNGLRDSAILAIEVLGPAPRGLIDVLADDLLEDDFEDVLGDIVDDVADSWRA